MSLLFDPHQPNKESLEFLKKTEKLVESEHPGVVFIGAMVKGNL